MYYTGHGEKGYIRTADFNFDYVNESPKNMGILNYILTFVNEQINHIGLPKKHFDDKYETSWNFRWFIDACYSGSAKDAGEKMVEEKKEYGG